MEWIKIYTRDINGKRDVLVFENEEAAYDFCEKMSNSDNEEPEILAVTMGEACLYSELMSDEISFADLTGFFA